MKYEVRLAALARGQEREARYVSLAGGLRQFDRH